MLRATSICRHSSAIIYIPPNSNIYAFGSPSQSKIPLISSISWQVEEGQAWAVVSGTGGGGKGVIFKTLLGHTRLAPPTPEVQGQWASSGGLYPFLSSSPIDPYTRISHVSFRQRIGAESGAFFDYTARYGAMREEDKITLRDSLEASLSPNKRELLEKLIEQIGLKPLLDLPLVTLSNGQTRRARVVKSILNQPELLLLDEPLAGLDASSRKAMSATLQQLHHGCSPRVVLGLRKGEDIPSWITHVLEITGRTARPRSNTQVSGLALKPLVQELKKDNERKVGKLLVDMQDVNVTYGDRKVLKNINWQIKQGERWHLQGSNGSGKTTLLALLTGDHPQSFTQKHLELPALPSSSDNPSLCPRKRIPTAHLRRVIGVVSPEMFDAFPRRHPGMSAWEAVTTGFDGGFVPRTRDASLEQRRQGGIGHVDVSDEELGLGLESVDSQVIRENHKHWRVARCWEVLKALGPEAWNGSDSTIDFARQNFSSLSAGEQRLVLLMRALVGRPPVVLLDEVWSGMDEDMIASARRYLRSEEGLTKDQAVIVITHWEEEVPWTGSEVKKFTL